MALKTDPPSPDKGGGEPFPRQPKTPSSPKKGGASAAPKPQEGIHPSAQPKAAAKPTEPDLFSFAAAKPSEPEPAPAAPIEPEEIQPTLPIPEPEPEPTPEPEAEPLPEPEPAPIALPPEPEPEPVVAPEPEPEAVAPAPLPEPLEEPVIFIPGPPRPQPQSQPQPQPEPAQPAPSAEPAPRPSVPSAQPPQETPAMATPQHIEDFRRNAERQKKEQTSFGNVVATLTYSILVALILVTGLAGYGGYVIFKKIELQRTTLAELDRRYEAEVVALKEDLSRTQGQLSKQNDTINAQQEQISRLRAAIDKVNADQFRNYSSLKAQVDQLQSRTPNSVPTR